MGKGEKKISPTKTAETSGVTIGKNAVVAAGAVISKDVPAKSLKQFSNHKI